MFHYKSFLSELINFYSQKRIDIIDFIDYNLCKLRADTDIIIFMTNL